MKAFATAFYNEKASVAAFTNYCIQEEWSIVVSFQKYRCQNRGTLVLKHTAQNCKLRICTFTPSGPFLGIGSGKVIKINSWINYLHILITKTWIPGCANKVWLIYRLRPLCKSVNRWSCTITEKAPTRAFSWLKAPTSAREILMGVGDTQPPLCWLPLWVVEFGLVAERCTNTGSLYIICQHNSSTP